MSVQVLQGNVFDVLPTLPAGSVDCCVTSPPYWKLRSYLPKDHELKPLELGYEQTPKEYIANMVRVFDLVKRVLAEHGTCWVNIGDTYWTAKGSCNNPGGGPMSGIQYTEEKDQYQTHRGNKSDLDLDSGNLCLIPQRLAIALQDAGWIVRSVVVWHKPAPMPSSITGWMWRKCRVKVEGRKVRHSKVAWDDDNRRPSAYSEDFKSFAGAKWKDCPGCPKFLPNGGYVLRRGSWRPTSSWEPILMLAKSKRYFADGEPTKTPAAEATVSRNQYTRILDDPEEQFAVRHDHETETSTANLRDVWKIASEALGEKHYAAFPSKLVNLCLSSGTSAKGYCPACGVPWSRVVKKEREHGYDEEAYGKSNDCDDQHAHKRIHRRLRAARAADEDHDNPFCGYETIGWKPSCNCLGAAEMTPRPGVVLDPFSGSGRTLLEARRLGLDAIGVELNPQYAQMSNRLLFQDQPLFTTPQCP